jgi:hypothetical protein
MNFLNKFKNVDKKQLFIVIIVTFVLYLIYTNYNKIQVKVVKNVFPINTLSKAESFATESQEVPLQQHLRIALYYSDRCSHCHDFINNGWGHFTSYAKDNMKNILVESISCDDNAQICNAEKIAGYPTVILYNNLSGNKIMYNGDRTKDDIINFINKNSD